jgi:LacI family transcriptional regulator
VSTVNRILGGSTSVRAATIQRVQDAAGEIGFYGVGVIDARKKESLPHYRLAFLLQQSHRELYQLIAQKIREAARDRRDAEVETVIEFADRRPRRAGGRELGRDGRDAGHHAGQRGLPGAGDGRH